MRSLGRFHFLFSSWIQLFGHGITACWVSRDSTKLFGVGTWLGKAGAVSRGGVQSLGSFSVCLSTWRSVMIINDVVSYGRTSTGAFSRRLGQRASCRYTLS